MQFTFVSLFYFFHFFHFFLMEMIEKIIKEMQQASQERFLSLFVIKGSIKDVIEIQITGLNNRQVKQKIKKTIRELPKDTLITGAQFGTTSVCKTVDFE